MLHIWAASEVSQSLCEKKKADYIDRNFELFQFQFKSKIVKISLF